MTIRKNERKPRKDMAFKQERKNWKPWWSQYSANGNTLEYQAVRYLPTAKILEEFKEMEWPQRQLVLARLRRCESEVSTKALPIVAPLVALLIVLFNILLGVVGKDTGPYAVVITFINGAVISLALTAAIGVFTHNRKDAFFTAWAEAFKDVHSLKTKLEEEDRKAKEEARKARIVEWDGWSVKLLS